MNCPRLSRWTQFIHKVLIRGQNQSKYEDMAMKAESEEKGRKKEIDLNMG